MTKLRIDDTVALATGSYKGRKAKIVEINSDRLVLDNGKTWLAKSVVLVSRNSRLAHKVSMLIGTGTSKGVLIRHMPKGHDRLSMA